MASPPAGTSKTKNQPHTLIHTRFCRVRIIFFETFRPYTTYVRIHICLPQAFCGRVTFVSRNLRRKGVSHFFSKKFLWPCATYIRQPPSFLLLLTILIMVFHKR